MRRLSIVVGIRGGEGGEADVDSGALIQGAEVLPEGKGAGKLLHSCNPRRPSPRKMLCSDVSLPCRVGDSAVILAR
jgi:hypothetical protein